jgi:hypothetical protein
MKGNRKWIITRKAIMRYERTPDGDWHQMFETNASYGYDCVFIPQSDELMVCYGVSCTMYNLTTGRKRKIDYLGEGFGQVETRWNHWNYVQLVRLADQSIFACGGTDKQGNRAMIFKNDKWRHAKHQMHDSRRQHRCALMRDGRVLIVGGQQYAGRNPIQSEIFDPESETFTAAPMPPYGNLIEHTCVALHDGRVLVGGIQINKFEPIKLCFFDPSTSTWTEGPSTDVRRSWYKLLSFDEGKVIVMVGGRGSDSVTSQMLDLVNNKWVNTTKYPLGYPIPVVDNVTFDTDVVFEAAD